MPRMLFLSGLLLVAGISFLLHTSARPETEKNAVISTWPAKVYAPFKKAEKKLLFFGTDLYRVDSVTLKGKKIHPIDSFMALKILKYRNVLPSATSIYAEVLQRNDYFSLDKPVNGFYPVTLIGHEKEGMRNLTMYLLDKKGQIKSSVKLAFRGTIHRLRASPLSQGNDSALVFTTPAYNHSYSQRTDDSTFYFHSVNHRMNFETTPASRVTHHADKYIIVRRDGTIEIREGKTWVE